MTENQAYAISKYPDVRVCTAGLNALVAAIRPVRREDGRIRIFSDPVRSFEGFRG